MGPKRRTLRIFLSVLSKPQLAVLAALLFAVLARSLPGLGGRGGPAAERAALIGFQFSQRDVEFPQGDISASGHPVLHLCTLSGDRVVTGAIHLNDTDEIPEKVTLLILRPVGEGWQVLQSVTLPDDVLPAAVIVFSILELAAPLKVQAGDVLAHWQPETHPSGPIPLSIGTARVVDGVSTAQAGFSSEDFQVRETIANAGFTGARDYALKTATPYYEMPTQHFRGVFVVYCVP